MIFENTILMKSEEVKHIEVDSEELREAAIASTEHAVTKTCSEDNSEVSTLSNLMNFSERSESVKVASKHETAKSFDVSNIDHSALAAVQVTVLGVEIGSDFESDISEIEERFYRQRRKSK